METAKALIEEVVKNEGFFTLLDIMPCGVSIATDTSCKTIIHNSMASKFFRFDKTWGSFSHSAETPPPVEVLSEGKKLTVEQMPMQRAAWNGETVIGVELEFIWPDGERKIGLWSARPLYLNGIIVGVIATCEDFTERKGLEREVLKHRDNLQVLVDEMTEELKRSERQHRTLIENAPMFIGRYDTNLRYVYVSPVSKKLFGIEPENFIGRTLYELGLDEVACQKNETFIKAVFSNRKPFNYEIEFPRGDSELVFNVNAIPEWDEHGQVETVLVIAEDITEKKKHEAELIRLDRMNIIGEMAASIGHEIRNPLTTVRGYLQMFQHKEEVVRYHEQFTTMIEELDRASFIISEYLSLAKNKMSVLKQGNLNEVIGNIIPLIQADAWRMNHSLETKLSPVPEFDFDDKEIRQLLLNLTRNGLEAMQESGTLTIATIFEAGRVLLAVRDTGKGISKEIMGKIGSPFFTTKENGNGLGLAVCYRIAERHNANLNIDSSPKGTTFTLAFSI